MKQKFNVTGMTCSPAPLPRGHVPCPGGPRAFYLLGRNTRKGVRRHPYSGRASNGCAVNSPGIEGFASGKTLGARHPARDGRSILALESLVIPMKQKFNVTGMTCSACSAHVEKAVRQVEGVDSVSVNLLGNSMLVEYGGKTGPEQIIQAVTDARVRRLPLPGPPGRPPRPPARPTPWRRSWQG